MVETVVGAATLTLEEPDEMAQAAAELAVQSTIAANLDVPESSVRILASSWTSAEGRRLAVTLRVDFAVDVAEDSASDDVVTALSSGAALEADTFAEKWAAASATYGVPPAW